jgi:hypothetical protein
VNEEPKQSSGRDAQPSDAPRREDLPPEEQREPYYGEDDDQEPLMGKK